MNTVLPLLALWALGFALVAVSIWATIAVSLITAGFIVRTFIIFHDCTHSSFFSSSKANDVVGFFTGVLTTFPYEKWKHEHTIHHASSGNLDKRGIGDIDMMTVDEYVQASKGQRAKYRFSRNPLVMFLLGPLFLIFYVSRFNRRDARMKERFNTYLTTVVIAGFWGLLIYFFGLIPFLSVIGVSMFIAAMSGIWLFYIQHTYEETYFEHDPEWDYVKAAIEGSSFYKLPKLLQWMTGSIGFHHIHHLAPRIPNYNLEQVHTDIELLKKGVTTITLSSSLACIRYRLYDVQNQKYMTFRDVKQYI
jgi:omega-6 fatty acid desaturase (delta-12 desaturase)